MMAWDDLDALEEKTYHVRRLRMHNQHHSTDEMHDYENRLQRAEMGDDLDDY